jgi:hypothetical protein
MGATSRFLTVEALGPVAAVTAGSVVLVAIDWRQIGRERFDVAIERGS